MRIWFLPFYFIIFIFYKYRAYRIYKKVIKKNIDIPVEARYKLVKNIAKITVFAFKVKIKTEGLDNIPKNKPFLLTPNHQSNFDPLGLFVILKSHPGFIAKEELINRFSTKSFLNIIFTFPIKRQNLRETIKLYEAARKYIITQREGLVIFPEGRRTHSSKMTDFLPGAFKIAVQGHIPVVPVTINNSYNVFKNKIFRKKITVEYIFHKPISTSGYSNTKIISDLVRKKISESITNE